MDGSGTGKAPGRTRLPAAERRDTILRAAAGVFAEAGYRAARVSEIASRVGVTEPVIFQNFTSKAALFAAVVEHAAAEVGQSLDDLTAGPGSGSGLLAHVLSGHPDGRPDPARAGRRAGHTSAEHATAAYGVLFSDAATLVGDPELSAPVLDAIRAVAAHLADLVRHAQAAGAIPSSVDPEAAGWLLLSVLSGRPLRAAAMPAGLEPAVSALALRALESPDAATPGHGAPEMPGREG